MKKTYITKMPNHIGAFLKASECFASLGINITRVSYNKAIDSHTLFIDAEGTEEKLSKADKMLKEIGYLHNEKDDESIVLIEFCLQDVPGSVTEVLKLINQFSFNISYISSQENGTEYQYFKMGLFVDDSKKINDFISSAERICKVRVIDYNHSEKVYDNSIFYNSFVSGISSTMPLSENEKNEILVNANLAMQILDENGLSPYKTFESIRRFAELLSASRNNKFEPRITHHKITNDTEIILIEPPCGSNTAIIKSMGKVLFVDSGYALYEEEMKRIFADVVENYDGIKKVALVTHADVDHCGLLDLFDEIIACENTAECLRLEYEGMNGYREQNPMHKPYINMCKVLTGYKPVSPDKINVLWKSCAEQNEPIVQIGFLDFGELHFEVYEGKGGHLKGETVLIDYKNHVVFTGDIYINLHELTKQQAEYNQYAPILMTSVDTDPELCSMERKAILQRLGAGNWSIFGAHGYKKEYKLNIDI